MARNISGDLSRDAAEYVLDTFPIVRCEGEAASGTYRIRYMMLAYMDALTAGDAETRIEWWCE